MKNHILGLTISFLTGSGIACWIWIIKNAIQNHRLNKQWDDMIEELESLPEQPIDVNKTR